jgi:hypothetical protein
LEPGGHLAIWGAGHVIPYDGDPFFLEIQDIYDEIGESMPPDTALPRPRELDDDRDEIKASGLFHVVDIAQFDWEIAYDAEGYIDQLDTFSGHIAMQDWQRDRLYAEIRRRLAQRPDVGQAVAQVPAEGDRDHVGREPKPGKLRTIEHRRPSRRTRHHPSLTSS